MADLPRGHWAKNVTYQVVTAVLSEWHWVQLAYQEGTGHGQLTRRALGTVDLPGGHWALLTYQEGIGHC